MALIDNYTGDNYTKKIYLCLFPTFSQRLLANNDFLWAQELCQLLENNPEVLIIVDTSGQQMAELKTTFSNFSNFHFLAPQDSLSTFGNLQIVHLRKQKDLSNFFDDFLNQTFASNSTIQIHKRFQQSDLSQDLTEILLNKKSKLINGIKSLNNLTSQSEKKLKASELFLYLYSSFTPIIYEHNNSTTLYELFYEMYQILLHAEVEYNYAKYPEIDPVIGWLNLPKDMSSDGVNIISNPFISLEFDSACKGILTNIDYFPRKESISEFNPSFYFSEDGIGKSNQTPKARSLNKPLLMRNNPDLFGIKFQEKLEFKRPDHTPQTITKVYYLRSGLTPLGNYSTTGFALDFWIEEEPPAEKFNLSESIFLHIAISLNCSLELARFRYLSDMGGVSTDTFSFKNSTEELIFIKEKSIGGLKGMRVIDSVNQFVTDFRFSKSLQEITICNLTSKLHDHSSLELKVRLRPRDIFGYDKPQNLTFSIF